MARSYASIALRIWSDDRFRARSMPAQWLYLRLVSDPRLSLAGVTEWNPKRIARSAGETSREDVDAARAELEHHRFICIDDDTDEVAVRSFMRNDKTLASQKTAVGVANALDGVESSTIRSALSLELHRMEKDDRAPHGLEVVRGFMAQNPPAEFPYPDTTGKGHPMPHQEGVSEGVSDRGVAELEPEPEPEPKPEPHSSTGSAGGPETDEMTLIHPEQAGPSIDDLFAEFWAEYPRREGRKKAREAYEKALGRADHRTILDGAHRYLIDPNREPAYTKLATTWLNGDHWEDDPLPARTQGTNAQDRRSEQIVDLVARNLPGRDAQAERGELEA